MYSDSFICIKSQYLQQHVKGEIIKTFLFFIFYFLFFFAFIMLTGFL